MQLSLHKCKALFCIKRKLKNTASLMQAKTLSYFLVITFSQKIFLDNCSMKEAIDDYFLDNFMKNFTQPFLKTIW